jgi:hypothetical protein
MLMEANHMHRSRKFAVTIICTMVFMTLAWAPTSAMTGAAHILGGAASGQVAGSPTGAFVVGVASHTLLDSVPHSEYSLATQALLAAGACLIVKQEYDRTGDWRIVAGALGGFIPDIEHGFRELGWQKKKHFPSHDNTLPHGHARKIWQGIWLETGMVGLLMGLSF